MATILISGGTGLIGKALTRALLQRDHQVIILSRQATGNTGVPVPGVSYASWDVNKGSIDESAIERAHYIIHLAGAGVADKRWTDKRKKEIVDSRVKSSELLINTMKRVPNSIKAVISASAIGWYGPDPVIPNPQPFREAAPAAADFLGTTCLAWEQSTEPVKALGKRLVKLRTGIVLSAEGGAVKEFVNPMRFGIAAILGHGKQVVSWIHIDDLVRLYLMAIDDEKMEGVYNAVAPKPVSNKHLILALAELKRGKFYIPIHVPSFALKIALGEMSIEVLKSATVSCDKAHVAGFVFQYPSLDAAIRQL